MTDTETTQKKFVTQQLAERPENTSMQQSSLSSVEVGRGSIVANIVSTLLLRIASRTSFVILGFYLGEHFASATIVAVVLEAFYISELVLAPAMGSLSDRLGRKPFLLTAPVLGIGAAVFFLICALLFPQPQADKFDVKLVVLLLLVLLGRLLEGAATGVNTPASLGYITDTTTGSAKLRTQVMTAFEVVTVGGLALAIPFGGQVSNFLGTWGFLVVVALHVLNLGLIVGFIKESTHHEARADHGSLVESLRMLGNKRIFTFLPAWLSVNALVGAWITLITIVLAYPNPAADMRFPGQLLYGGFSKGSATMLLGGFGLLFLLGMGLWMLVLPRMRRTTTMLIGLGGLSISIIVLTLINGLAENPQSIAPQAMTELIVLLVPLVLGIVLLSGFTPAALTQMASIAETQKGKRGAVMGLYSVVLGIGQLLGASLGGMSVDAGGFYGLMIFSVVLGLLALASVLYMRAHRDDLI
ncbi:MFS transporter [Ktedonosporobacter rubrisoli]|nr:MFS transporter [Ktedonosporobacter rubrisoli]